MKKYELIDSVNKSIRQVEISKHATEQIIDTLFDEIAKAIRRERRFIYPGFGTFSVRRRKARVGRNPQTGQEIRIPATLTVGFRPAPGLKRSL